MNGILWKDYVLKEIKVSRFKDSKLYDHICVVFFGFNITNVFFIFLSIKIKISMIN